MVVAQQSGCQFVDEEVLAVHPAGGLYTVESKGTVIEQVTDVVVAAGAFCNFRPLLCDPAGRPVQLELQLLTAQVAKIEVTEATVAEQGLGNMPSIIFKDTARFWAYLLPPIKYPDGKIYMKIGGARYDEVADSEASLPGLRVLRTEAEVNAWYGCRGDDALHDKLLEMFETLFPRVPVVRTVKDSCVTAHTPTKRAYIGHARRGLSVVAGGNGYAAKSADRIGALGALMVVEDPAWTDTLRQRFQPLYASTAAAHL